MPVVSVQQPYASTIDGTKLVNGRRQTSTTASQRVIREWQVRGDNAV